MSFHRYFKARLNGAISPEDYTARLQEYLTAQSIRGTMRPPIEAIHKGVGTSHYMPHQSKREKQRRLKHDQISNRL